MFRNYITVTLRSFLRHKGYSLINIFGLATGLACCILALLFIRDELSFDRFHERADSIYRITIENRLNGIRAFGGVERNLFTDMVSTLPNVDRTTFVRNGRRVVIQYGDDVAYQDDFRQVDEHFLTVFNFPLKRGNAATALERPGTIVLTPSVAERFFGDAEPMGQTLLVNGETEYEVTGVLAEDPANSHLQFSMLGSMATYFASGYDPSSHFVGYGSYIVAEDGTGQNELQKDLAPLIGEVLNGHLDDWALHVESVPNIYLHPSTFQRGQNTLRGDMRYIYIFSAIAVLILLIACVNYMNLATARAARRSREVGVRKIVGAGRGQLIRQFLGESFVFSLLALILGAGLTELLLPGFNQMVGKQLSLRSEMDGTLFGLLGAVALLVGFVAGAYPALVLSSFRPIDAFRGFVQTPNRRTGWLRKGLVIFQFGISAFLIVGTLIIQDQLRFVADRNLGLDTDQVVLLQPEENTRTRYSEFKQSLQSLPGVDAVTSAPLPGASTIPFRRPGSDEDFFGSSLGVDFDFLQVMDVELIEGRPFDPAVSTDAGRAMIVNEAAVREMGWSDPIGEKLYALDLANSESVAVYKELEVIGVARDFHTRSLFRQVGPTFMFINESPLMGSSVLVKLNEADVSTTLAQIQDNWSTFEPANPFEYTFLDEKYSEYYVAERRLGTILSVFSFLAIFIAGLGLFGLVAYMTERRTKEIGIRKTLGATTTGMVFLLSKEFLRLVVIATLLFAPLAYLGIDNWLERFAYRIELGVTPFLVALGLALVIAILTISTQTIRAALSNPADSLRSD